MPDKTLVIVESPAKAKKIGAYLGPDYTVLASVGHIRDLASKVSEMPPELRKKPWAKLAVDVDGDFHPEYVIHASKSQTITNLKKALKDADALLLATDEDREGEAISWHLMEVLRPKVPVGRMVFNEITEHAIREAVANPRDIDMELVDAQETRRILDRLYGYPVSEVLWKKIGPFAKSAGRVQSVAVRLVVHRERERIAFTPVGYWDITGIFNPESFKARLDTVDGRRIAQGTGDFDEQGIPKKADMVVLDEARATGLAADLANREFTVRSVVQKPQQRQPKAPFITSTLQQEASNRYRWGAQRTMRIAQSLYENGFITYMRTDSVQLSAEAVSAARSQARDLYGPEYVPDKPRTYPNKSKNAQEAHEAIRPAGENFRTPGEVSRELNPDELALYDLIWKRTVASQMSNAQVATTTVRLEATTASGTAAEFTASGTVVVFPGFLAALKDVSEDDSDDDRELPVMFEGMKVTPASLDPAGHTTTPPARYTEAKLVAKLEELGIGRPSTYASIMSTIVDRGYVWKKGTALVPSFTAFAVVRLLEEHFGALVDYDFTKNLEEMLDLIANGEADRVEQLEAFWRGGHSVSGEFPGVKPLTEDLGAIDARGIATFPIEGTDIMLRVGRYGAYVERGEERANVPIDTAPDELTAELAEKLILEPSGERELGVNPETGLTVVAKSGRFGPYVSELLPEGAPKSAKPRTGSLLQGMALSTITLEDALRILSLPRVVGNDPADGVPITVQNGRYGPYLTKEKDSRSLESEDQLFTLTLEQALALLAQPKQRGRNQPKGPLREVGKDLATGLMITVREGRFGPYVTDGETNASLRSADDPMTIELDRASDLIAERRIKDKESEGEPKPARKAAARKTTKATATKAAARKTTAKAPAKKTAKKTVKKAAAKAPAPKAAADTAPAIDAPAEPATV